MSDPPTPASPGYVVDASVGVKLFIDDPLSERAHQLFELLTAEKPVELYVPDLFYIECTNVLWKYVRWGGLALETARDNLNDLSCLRLNVVSTADLMAEALELAARYTLIAYDACYVALAQRLDLTLVTADAKLAAAAPLTQWLGSLDIVAQ